MNPNPLLGVLFHWIGGFASASFYLPYRRVRGWSWETYWLVGGVFSWIVAPLTGALSLVPGVWPILAETPLPVLCWTYFFGVLWGIGGLTFGLTMRYLGIALGMAVALGFCAAFGTIMPPLFRGELGGIASTFPGVVILSGVAVCLAGIAVSGLAGMSKEKELPEEEKKKAVKEFNFAKGMLVAVFSGIMSSCFAYGLAAGKPIAATTKDSLVRTGGNEIWQNLPVLIVVLLGGFTTNFIWCVILNLRNRSTHEYLNLRPSAVAEVSAAEGVMLSDAAEETSVQDIRDAASATQGTGGFGRLLNNYLFSALAGVTWYLQFFFYSMGEVKMGAFNFSSWTLHMASIIIFSTLWGIFLREWKGTSRRTHLLISVGLALLILSTLIVGCGNLLKSAGGGH
jgi:L-rhamnose-H+ transport protein